MMSNFDILDFHIAARGSACAVEKELMKSLAVPKRLKRKQLLLREGDICRHLTFVSTGCLRSYRISERGEHVLEFYPPGSWLTDLNGLHNRRPARFFVDSVEDSQLLQWSIPSIERLQLEVPVFQQIQKEIIRYHIDNSQERIFSLISCSAESRFSVFIKKYPELIDRVPLYMVASYLGLTRETLTRLKKACYR